MEDTDTTWGAKGAAVRRHRMRLTLGAIVVTAATVITGCSSGSSNSDQASSAPFVKAVKAVRPSVVEIRTSEGLGSGVVISSNGDIVTNRHVVGFAPTVQVRASSGKTFSATVVGTSPTNDLAVVRAEGADLPPAALGDSSKLRIGDIVLAVGNPLGLDSSVTDGIVSALGRTVDESRAVELRHLIQTSAPINPGNSGGALVDLHGRVVGIPTLEAVNPEDDQAASGIGFAIPSNSVKSISARVLDEAGG
jgi:putative serine protease PepD